MTAKGIAAGIILVVFFGISIYMLAERADLSQADQFKWDRAFLIYKSLETFAVAAAGILLGTQIQQSRAEEAETRAQAASASAEASKTELENMRGAIGAIDAVTGEVEPIGGAAPRTDGLVDPLTSVRAIVRKFAVRQ